MHILSRKCIHERYSDKTKCMYFMIKDQKKYKYMTIWEILTKITKKLNTKLIYNKKYLKAEERFNTKESFQCFYILVILFDSVYRKGGNYHPKAFLEKLIQNFYEKYKKFWFLVLWEFLLKYKKILFPRI